MQIPAITGDISFKSTGSVSWNSGAIGSGYDLTILRDAANTLALRNGVNAQSFRVYNTYTDAINYERASFGFAGDNIARLSVGTAGTGTQRQLTFNTGADRWTISATGHFIAGADNTYDIGAAGATRPRDLYIAGSSFAGANVTAGNALLISTKGGLAAVSDGVWRFGNAAFTDFNRLQFGGTTTNYPAIQCITNVAGAPYLKFVDATAANPIPINVGGVQGGYTKVCTSAVSNALFYVSVPNTNIIGGRVLYTVNSTDGTDAQQITGTAQFGAVGKGTAVTANVSDVQNTSTVSAGTLTASLTANVSTNNVFALMVTPTTSLTTTNLTVKWRLETPSTYVVNAL